MLVEHQPIKADLVRVLVFIQVFVVEVRTQSWIEVRVRKCEPYGAAKAVLYILFRVGYVSPFGEAHKKHSGIPPFARGHYRVCPSKIKRKAHLDSVRRQG